MPINIYSKLTGQENFYLGENDWDLASLLATLETWLRTGQNLLPSEAYVADIGFVSNPSQSGGGGSLTSDSLKRISKMGIELHFSEYPE